MKNICNTRKNGLSPLARGARHSQADPATALRFIPAGAGNTAPEHLPQCDTPVYPRWRGEHARLVGVFREIAGLSPLARGTLRCYADRAASRRFIPAGAGNTLSYFFIVHIHAVYPRWRGEHSNLFFLVRATSGLSPLARGTHCHLSPTGR